jgi:hypothetical protein
MRAPTLLTILLGATLPGVLVAQGDPRLDRVDPAARAQVARVIDSLHALGVPAEPLIDKALEGTAKHASAALIAAALRNWGGQLATAQNALGAGAEEPEVVAGASALRSGVATTVLTQIAAARPGRDMLVPLAVLTELIGQGIPADSAAAAVVRVALRGGQEEDYRGIGRETATAHAPVGTPIGAPAGTGRPTTPAGGPPGTPPGSGHGHGRP